MNQDMPPPLPRFYKYDIAAPSSAEIAKSSIPSPFHISSSNNSDPTTVKPINSPNSVSSYSEKNLVPSVSPTQSLKSNFRPPLVPTKLGVFALSGDSSQNTTSHLVSSGLHPQPELDSIGISPIPISQKSLFGKAVVESELDNDESFESNPIEPDSSENLGTIWEAEKLIGMSSRDIMEREQKDKLLSITTVSLQSSLAFLEVDLIAATPKVMINETVGPQKAKDDSMPPHVESQNLIDSIDDTDDASNLLELQTTPPILSNSPSIIKNVDQITESSDFHFPLSDDISDTVPLESFNSVDADNTIVLDSQVDFDGMIFLRQEIKENRNEVMTETLPERPQSQFIEPALSNNLPIVSSSPSQPQNHNSLQLPQNEPRKDEDLESQEPIFLHLSQSEESSLPAKKHSNAASNHRKKVVTESDELRYLLQLERENKSRKTNKTETQNIMDNLRRNNVRAWVMPVPPQVPSKKEPSVRPPSRNTTSMPPDLNPTPTEIPSEPNPSARMSGGSRETVSYVQDRNSQPLKNSGSQTQDISSSLPLERVIQFVPPPPPQDLINGITMATAEISEVCSATPENSQSQHDCPSICISNRDEMNDKVDTCMPSIIESAQDDEDMEMTMRKADPKELISKDIDKQKQAFTTRGVRAESKWSRVVRAKGGQGERLAWKDAMFQDSLDENSQYEEKSKLASFQQNAVMDVSANVHNNCSIDAKKSSCEAAMKVHLSEMEVRVDPVNQAKERSSGDDHKKEQQGIASEQSEKLKSQQDYSTRSKQSLGMKNDDISDEHNDDVAPNPEANIVELGFEHSISVSAQIQPDDVTSKPTQELSCLKRKFVDQKDGEGIQNPKRRKKSMQEDNLDDGDGPTKLGRSEVGVMTRNRVRSKIPLDASPTSTSSHRHAQSFNSVLETESDLSSITSDDDGNCGDKSSGGVSQGSNLTFAHVTRSRSRASTMVPASSAPRNISRENVKSKDRQLSSRIASPLTRSASRIAVAEASVALFAEIAFVVTSMRSDSKDAYAKKYGIEEEVTDYNRSKIVQLITEHGGVIVSNLRDVYDNTRRNLLSSKELICVSPAPTRTMKFLQCLALNIPRVSCQWILDCATENKLLDHKDYLLSNGFSFQVNAYVGNITFKEFFRDCVFCVMGESKFRLDWELCLRGTGATIHPKVTDQVNYILSSSKPRSTTLKGLHPKCKIVTKDWVIQCLILQKLVPLDSFSVYCHPC
ncbi:hypothetical protein BKA69DRAFT_1074545 [Paraphysoderma sedebokerense]|nr:hypothetical protein BKA69DRAFT_1074545 [Paraphysoderma sedebokerense]